MTNQTMTHANVQAKCISKILIKVRKRRWVTRFCYEFRTPAVSDTRLQNVIDQIAPLALIGVVADDLSQAIAARLAYDVLQPPDKRD